MHTVYNFDRACTDAFVSCLGFCAGEADTRDRILVAAETIIRRDDGKIPAANGDPSFDMDPVIGDM